VKQQKQVQPDMATPYLARGFTVAEMVVVVMILAIIAATGIPLLTTSMNHYRLRGAAEEVVNAIQYAQMSAVTSGMRTRAIISPTGQSISVSQYMQTANLVSGGNQLAAASVESGSYVYMEYPLKRGVNYLINLSAEDRFRGVYIIWSDFNLLLPLSFNAQGKPSHGGNVILVLSGQQMTVNVDALTGKVGVSN